MDELEDVVERLRAHTPGLAGGAGQGGVTHLNNAGCALPPAIVLDTVIDHLRLEARIGGYEAAEQVADRMAAGYAGIAALIGARPEEIAFAPNATRAWDMAFYAIPLRPGQTILTTRSEYPSNAIAYLQVARRTGATVEVVPDDGTGQIDLDALAARLDAGGVRVVAINHVPTHDGLINPAAEIGALTRQAGALYLLDACQSVGQLDIDVRALGVDLLSATGRKFLRGPRGTGFLYVRREIVDELEPPFLDLAAATWTGADQYTIRPDARRFETWERSVAGQLGLGAAAGYAMALGMPAIERRVRALAARLRAELAAVPGVRVRDRGRERCGIVTFTCDGMTADSVATALRAKRINVSVARQTYRYDGERGGPLPRVRASVHYYNTVAEITALVRAVAGL